jgi:hypothetical protein
MDVVDPEVAFCPVVVVVEVVDVVDDVELCPVGVVVVVVGAEAAGATATDAGAVRARVPLSPQAIVRTAFRPSLERRRA